MYAIFCAVCVEGSSNSCVWGDLLQSGNTVILTMALLARRRLVAQIRRAET